jgi:tripartite-type tricarboxylate transporter receptor subunit TctC
MFNKKSLLLITILSTTLIIGAFSTSAMAEWSPSGPIKLMIAFKAGGGADTQARLIAEELQKRHGWKIIPAQVTGKGGLNLAKALKKSPNDGTVIGIIVSETLGYNLVAAKKSGIQLKDFTSLTTTAGFQMGVVALTGKGWKTFHDVIKAAKGGQKIRFGAMSPRLADIAYLLGKNNGVEFNIVMVKGGKGVMNGLNAGDIDVGFVAGIQAKAVKAGDMVNLASGRSEPLQLSPDAPLVKDLGVDFPSDGYFMFAAPAGLPDDARKAISDAITEIVTDPSTKANGYLNKAFGGTTIIKGGDLDQYLAKELERAKVLLKQASE